MAGTMHSEKKYDSDILFDLTIDDDRNLSESELLSLVNYGQVTDSIKVCGSDGATHSIQLALLWDEDYIDILKKTSKYATDPSLRARLVRRLRLHKAIQKIDSYQFDDPKDVAAQRNLWHLLCRMADVQIEYLDGKYGEMETLRNSNVVSDIKSLDTSLRETAPEEIRKKLKKQYQEEIKSKPYISENPKENTEDKISESISEDPIGTDIKNRQETQKKGMEELANQMGVNIFEETPKAVSKKKDGNV